MKYLAAKLVILQEARSQGKTKTEKTDESCHPPHIQTKLLQGKVYVFKRGRLLGLRAVLPREAELRRNHRDGCQRGRGQGRPRPPRAFRPGFRDVEKKR